MTSLEVAAHLALDGEFVEGWGPALLIRNLPAPLLAVSADPQGRRHELRHPVTDHDQIRRWVEDNGGRPSLVRGAGGGDDPGMLRIDFDAPDEGLEEIPWDAWFEDFDRNNLALLCSPDRRFNKLIRRA